MELIHGGFNILCIIIINLKLFSYGEKYHTIDINFSLYFLQPV